MKGTAFIFQLCKAEWTNDDTDTDGFQWPKNMRRFFLIGQTVGYVSLVVTTIVRETIEDTSVWIMLISTLVFLVSWNIYSMASAWREMHLYELSESCHALGIDEDVLEYRVLPFAKIISLCSFLGICISLIIALWFEM